MTLPQVSVVLPLFGAHPAIDTLSAVCQAWVAQDMPCEVVAAVAGERLAEQVRNSVGELARVVVAEAAMLSTGPLRNLAASVARAPVLYLGDADIVPVGADFLRRAERLRDGAIIIQPWQYRLVNAGDLARVPMFHGAGRVRACYVRSDPEGHLTPVPGEKFTWGGTDMWVDPPAGVEHGLRDGEPWRKPAFHWGGVLIDRKAFDAIGRYYARYVGWGCEDDDLIIKLAAADTAVIRAWRADRRLTCLHFEHPPSYTSSMVAANQAVLARRRAAGPLTMIEEDLR